MGILVATTPAEIVRHHIKEMRTYADQLERSRLPLVKRKAIINRIRKCAAETEHAYRLLAAANLGKQL